MSDTDLCGGSPARRGGIAPSPAALEWVSRRGDPAEALALAAKVGFLTQADCRS